MILPKVESMKMTPQSVAVLTLIFVSFSLLPQTRAVIPLPDGGYPGGNTAEGQDALLSLTTGTFNTAVGFVSLQHNRQLQHGCWRWNASCQYRTRKHGHRRWGAFKQLDRWLQHRHGR